eukprot:CAMPEP_0118951318 /NCGR_PEP_ID=MMETSP1169-20130426/52902_1 /TAXON_ID=36882 /ORGANISM="Pyramimonas obovata, Strain CCMP722" /LENGTH=184 /DNA_ID=CAMNT_0006898353 /DNA_START=311 /DNA_END=861 /DNA_ORIENTATION=-
MPEGVTDRLGAAKSGRFAAGEQLVHKVQPVEAPRNLFCSGQDFRLENGVVQHYHLPGLVEHRRHRVYENLKPVVAHQPQEHLDVDLDSDLNALLDVLVAVAIHRDQDSFPAIDLSEGHHHLRAPRQGLHRVEELHLWVEGAFVAHVPRLQARRQQRHQHARLPAQLDLPPRARQAVAVAGEEQP